MAGGLGLVLVLGAASWALINPRFTPRHLVEQADIIFTARPEATASPLEWRLASATPLKGKTPAEHILNLAGCPKDHAQDIAQALKSNGKEPLMLCAGNVNEEKQAFLHVAGTWLNLKAGGEGRWDVLGYAPQMGGVFAGGTDMLIRMSQYLIQHSDADVPVSARVRWTGHAKVGTVAGRVAGLAAVDLGDPGKVHLFVASSEGDRLYRPKADDAFDDATAAAKLDTRSRRFTWVDLNGDGLADLVSWDGMTITARLAGPDGTFRPAGDGFSLKLDTDCLGIAPGAADGRPAVLVSTDGAPVWLVADAKSGWKKVDLPPSGGKETTRQVLACVVADLDNDGYADVLQPGGNGGLLWRGKAGGFAAPVKVPVGCGPGGGVAAVGDFNQDGALDIFLAGREKNTLWENDGRGNFREVLAQSGSLSYKCPPRAADALVSDLNHDGRQDICLVYETGDLLYHWNRGFRSFGEEGEVQLPGVEAASGQPRPGQKALAVADFNGDGSCDLATLFTNGDVYCYFNDQSNMPAVRLRLPKGVAGPVTVSGWIGGQHPVCTGALSVAGQSPAAWICTRFRGPCLIKYRFPGKAERSEKITVTDGPGDVVLAN
jgi:hypothetical protein